MLTEIEKLTTPVVPLFWIVDVSSWFFVEESSCSSTHYMLSVSRRAFDVLHFWSLCKFSMVAWKENIVCLPFAIVVRVIKSRIEWPLKMMW